MGMSEQLEPLSDEDEAMLAEVRLNAGFDAADLVEEGLRALQGKRASS